MKRTAKRNLRTPRKNSTIYFQQLRYAVAAADHGSFRAAAEMLRVQQVTVSRCVRQLEQRVGTRIFDRYSGGVRATQFGGSFLRVARSILEQGDSLLNSGRMTARGESGRLAIGFYTSISTGNLLSLLVEYKQQFPQVDIQMIERSRDRLTTALRNRAVDVAIVTGEGALPGAKSMPVWSERMLAVLPANHRLAERQTLSWTDLSGETVSLGLRDPGPAIHECLVAELISPEDRPQIEWHDATRETLKSLVGAFPRIGLTLESSLGTNSDGVVYREIRDGAGSTRIGLSVNWRADNESPALANFLKLLKRRYPSPS